MEFAAPVSHGESNIRTVLINDQDVAGPNESNGSFTYSDLEIEDNNAINPNKQYNRYHVKEGPNLESAEAVEMS